MRMRKKGEKKREWTREKKRETKENDIRKVRGEVLSVFLYFLSHRCVELENVTSFTSWNVGGKKHRTLWQRSSVNSIK